MEREIQEIHARMIVFNYDDSIIIIRTMIKIMYVSFAMAAPRIV